MNRRTFLQTGALGILGLHGSMHGIIPDDSAGYDLAVVTGPDSPATVRAAVDAIGGIRAFVRPGDVVLLKPNVSFPNPPQWGSTTHPDIIRAVGTLCMEAGAKRIIAADFPMSRPALCFERSGMTALSATMKDLSFMELKEESQFESVPIPGGEEIRELKRARILGKADVFINLPSAKAHSATGISFGLKNLMGLFWNRQPFHDSYDLHNAIVDAALVMKPHLTILDATYVLLTNGPQGPGRTAQLNTVIAGTDPLAVDAAGCGLADWNNRTTTPGDIRHLVRASERGFGNMELSGARIFRKTLS